MPSVFTRKLNPPKASFFLLGPRATGKSTWIQEHFSSAPYYDLLNSRELIRLNEIRAYFAYSNLRYPLHFWRSHDGVEVDLLCETKNGFVAIEIKAAERWNKRFNHGLVPF